MREKQKGGALSKVQKLKKRLSQSFGKLGKWESVDISRRRGGGTKTENSV